MKSADNVEYRLRLEKPTGGPRRIIMDIETGGMWLTIMTWTPAQFRRHAKKGCALAEKAQKRGKK